MNYNIIPDVILVAEYKKTVTNYNIVYKYLAKADFTLSKNNKIIKKISDLSCHILKSLGIIKEGFDNENINDYLELLDSCLICEKI